ncbi:MAG: ParB/RepB/Spo0J family partition protein [Micromonosporaceae bacterium]
MADRRELSNGRKTGLPRSSVTAKRPELHLVPLRLLLPADSPRLVGEDAKHIRVLAESDAVLPPILVHRGTMRIVDGMHRVGAARLRGREAIEVTFFEGSEAEAFVVAVQQNVKHGLPLTLADREAAAARIMASHPRWSDRAIAAATGLAAKTVAAVRRRTVAGRHADVRIGRDGRARPLNSAEGRRLASKVIAARPDASLREIAKAAGISPATARDVRDRMHRGDDPVPPKQRTPAARSAPRRRAEVGPPPATRSEREPTSVLENLRQDPSLRFADSGRALLRWLSAHAIEPGEWRAFVDATPPHCAYIVAGLARACANEWLDFASQLDQRVRAQEDDRSTA